MATVDFLPADLARASFVIASQEFAPDSNTIGFSADDLAREVTVRVRRRVPISGRMIGIDGRPAQGILLTIAGRPLTNGSFLTSGPNARTRADGTFRFNERPEMSSMIAVVDERWAAVSKSGIENHEGQPVEGVELRLVPGTVIRGRVTVGPEQQPVVGQEVVLSEQGPVVNGRAPGGADPPCDD